MTGKKPWIVAFTFGLLHGFGFAGALSDIGLPQTEIPLALAFFNMLPIPALDGFQALVSLYTMVRGALKGTSVALAFFNIGVELGQIIFVVVMLLVIYLINLKKNWSPVLRKVPAYAIGSLAAFWMIERIVGFWA